VLSFGYSSAMHSQSSNNGAVGVDDVARMLVPALSVNHGITMDRLGIIWYIGPLNRIMRHKYIPLLVTAD
jgi:hypothetical protein